MGIVAFSVTFSQYLLFCAAYLVPSLSRGYQAKPDRRESPHRADARHCEVFMYSAEVGSYPVLGSAISEQP